MKKYTIVVMRELGDTFRFTIRKNMIITVIALAIILSCAAIFGTWSSINSAYKNSILTKQVQSLQSRINILEAEQARLENYSEYMDQKSSNVFINPMKDVIGNADNLTERQDAMPAPSMQIPVSDDPLNIDIVEKHLETFTSLPFNLGVLTLENIETSPHRDKNRYYIAFDLYNTEKRGQVAGHVEYSLLKGGDLHNEFPIRASRGTDFSINNYKRTNALITVPDSAFEENDLIKLSIITGDSVVFVQLIPLGG